MKDWDLSKEDFYRYNQLNKFRIGSGMFFALVFVAILSTIAIKFEAIIEGVIVLIYLLYLLIDSYIFNKKLKKKFGVD